MSLLDRLRGQPDWQHEDPQVRASAVDSLENDAQDVFAAIASEDADAGVRLAAVGRLSDPETIGRIARTDADGQVRDEAASMLREIAVEATEPDVGEAALAGLSEPRDLGEVARTARLEAVSRSALGRLEAQKAIGAVARRSTHRDVRAAALDRLDDRGELVAVAVKTDHREIALAAFERLAPLGPADRDMLRTIAVRARTKPVSRRAKTALAELDARPVPLTAAERRRRREALCDRVEALVGVDRWDEVTAALDRAERDWRELEDDGGGGGAGASAGPAVPVAAGERAAPEARAAAEEPAVAEGAAVGGEPVASDPTADDGTAAAALVDAPVVADAPVTDVAVADAPAAGDAAVTDGAAADVAVVDAPAAGDGAVVDAPPPADASAVDAPTAADAAVAERWRAAVAAGLDHLARLDAARSAADRQRQVRGEALAARGALCDRLTALAADETRGADALAAEIGGVRAEWAALPEVPPGGGDAAADTAAGDDPARADASTQVERRFADLAAAAERQVERRRAAAARVVRLTALAERLEAVSATQDLEELTTGWKAPHGEWAALAGESTPGELAELAPRVAAAEQKRGDRLFAAREARRRREQANLVKQKARCDEIERAVADEQLELRDAESHLRLTRSLLGNLGRLPTRQDREALTNRLRAAQTGLTGRVRELRGLVEWKQWANVGLQAGLCERLEALGARGEEDDEAFAREFRQIMSEWRQASDVSRDEDNDVWRRFKAAHDALHPRFEAHRAAQDAVRGENLAKKVALCEEAEKLAESTEWIKAAQRITEMQEQWKQVGAATRKDEREVWNRFRAACGHFFRRRRQDLAERKQVWAKNAQSKEELCAKAEALAGEADLDAAKAAVRQLQAEWKTVGPVRRSRSEALWQRFRAACDQVYTRAREAVDAPFAEHIRARAALCERLEGLASEAGADGGGDGGTGGEGGADAVAAAGPSTGPAETVVSPPAPAVPTGGGADGGTPPGPAETAASAPVPAASTGDDPGDGPPPDSAETAVSAPAIAASTGGDADAGPPPGPAETAVSAPAPAAPTGGGVDGPPPDMAEAVQAIRTEWRGMEPIPRPQERSLTARFDAALGRVVARFPGAFAGTDLDPARHVPALERLCERVESMIRQEEKSPSAEGRSPSEILAARLREALASNTMGGRADAEAKRRDDAETVRRLQAERRALGTIPGDAGRQLSERFRAACDRYFKLNPPPPEASKPRGGAPRGGGRSRGGGSRRRRD